MLRIILLVIAPVTNSMERLMESLPEGVIFRHLRKNESYQAENGRGICDVGNNRTTEIRNFG